MSMLPRQRDVESTISYEQALEQYKHLINQEVYLASSGVQGYRTGLLLNILPSVVGRGCVVYLVKLASGLICRLIDWRLLPMSDAPVFDQELVQSPELAEAEQETKKKGRAAKAPKAPKAAATPKAPRVAAERVQKPCLCGCGGLTYSNFVPGHDMRAKSALRKAADDVEERAALPAALVAFVQSNEKWLGWFPYLAA